MDWHPIQGGVEIPLVTSCIADRILHTSVFVFVFAAELVNCITFPRTTLNHLLLLLLVACLLKHLHAT